jgi:hypothetical protein
VDTPRPDTVTLLNSLPAQGDPLLAVAIPDTARRLLWLHRKELWTAPILPNALVAWSQSRPAAHTPMRDVLLGVALPLETEDIQARALGNQVISGGRLPAPGQPLLVDTERREAHWKLGRAVLHAPICEDGLLAFGPTNFVMLNDLGPHERARAEYASDTLRQASLDATSTSLHLPLHPAQPRDIHLRDLAFDSIVGDRTPDSTGADVLTLRHTQHVGRVGGGIAVDCDMALALAADLIAHPASPPQFAARVPHQRPDRDNETVTVWHVTEDVTLTHDLGRRPQVLLLVCPASRPLTETDARRLACALTAGADRLSRVYQLTVQAVHQDQPRRRAMLTEAAFSTAALKNLRGGA